MIKLAIVAGTAVHKLADTLNKKEFSVEKKYEKIDELWDEILEGGNSSFVDIDKIVVVQNGFLSPNEIPYAEQVLNLQSIMAISNLRSTLYFTIKDTELYEEISKDQEEFIIYSNFNMLVFQEITIKVLDEILKGRYDAVGLFHPDFLKKNELDEHLNKQEEEADKPEEEEVQEEVETFKDFADSDEMKKEMRKKEIEEKKRKAAEEKERLRLEREKKKEEDRLSRIKKQKSKPKVEKPPVKAKPKPAKNKKRDKVDLYRGTIAVTGSRQSGVSTTVANMAEVYAHHGHTVLIIDLDIKRRFQTYLYPTYDEAINFESRIAHALLVNLINPKNLDEVHAVVSDNVALLTISQDIEKNLKKFANRPLDKVYSGANMVNLLSFAKSMFDVVILDMPFEAVKDVGECLSYVDKVITCLPNTEYHLDQLVEVEIEDLLNHNELVANTLLSKSKLLLTKYSNKSKIMGKEITPKLVMDLLANLEESILNLEVIGRVPFTSDYEKQFENGKKIVKFNQEYKFLFEDFMNLI